MIFPTLRLKKPIFCTKFPTIAQIFILLPHFFVKIRRYFRKPCPKKPVFHIFGALRILSNTAQNRAYNASKNTTFNFAAEIARLVKRSTFATAKDRIFIVHVFTSLQTCEKSSPSQIDICSLDDFIGTFCLAIKGGKSKNLYKAFRVQSRVLRAAP